MIEKNFNNSSGTTELVMYCDVCQETKKFIEWETFTHYNKSYLVIDARLAGWRMGKKQIGPKCRKMLGI